MDKQTKRKILLGVFHRLFARYGPQHWWPAEEPVEVIIGAILTQSAAWTNVEKAIASLKAAGVLSPGALRRIPGSELAALIHSCGYYNAKATKLKAFARWFGENFNDSIEKLSAVETRELRKLLLSVHGIGDETADSIILYAANKPIFVIDAYTRRIIDRIGVSAESKTYSAYQVLFMDNLPHDTVLFNEYHALLVQLGKDACRKQPLCQKCCLREMCGVGAG